MYGVKPRQSAVVTNRAVANGGRLSRRVVIPWAMDLFSGRVGRRLRRPFGGGVD